MAYTSRKMWAELTSADALARAKRRSGHTYESLAGAVTSELLKIKRDYRRRKIDIEVKDGCSGTAIWHLVVGNGNTVNETLGIAIERALGVTEGDLFVPKVLHGGRNEQPAA